MTSRQLVDRLEAKLAAVGVQKMVPESAVFEKASRRAVRQAAVQKAMKRVIQTLNTADVIPISWQGVMAKAVEEEVQDLDIGQRVQAFLPERGGILGSGRSETSVT
jgi:hypothetical protein